jgi:hypothetical protein
MALFRQMLLDVLAQNPGATEAENAYLGAYRKWLKSLVDEDSSTRVPGD